MNIAIQVGKTIIGREETNSVNSRDIHEYVESKQEYSNWIKKRLDQLGAVKGEDYLIILSDRSDGMSGRGRSDYIVTLNIAKHLAMMERNAKGKEVRNYFIAVEKKFRAEEGGALSSETIMPLLQVLLKQQEAIIELLNKLTSEREAITSNALTPEQLGQIKLAVNRAAKPLAECHSLSWGRAVKEVYSELNGRMGVFSYYQIAPTDYDEALHTLERMKEVKEHELKTGERLPVQVNINIEVKEQK